MEKILLIDPEKCTGCRSCETACSMHNEKVSNPNLARIHIVKWETSGLYVPIVCLHCEDPICEDICPVKAIKRDQKTGAVTIDDKICVGCRLCVIYCPFGGPRLNSKTGKPLKCNLCNGDPVCVKFCEPKALQYVDETKANFIKRQTAAARFSELVRKLLGTFNPE